MRGLVEGVVVTLIGALAAWGAYLTPPAPYEGDKRRRAQAEAEIRCF